MSFPRPVRHNSFFILQLSILIGGLLLAACSLAEDITPPPGYQPPQPTATPTPSVPNVKPSIARGAEVYAQNCTRCHGVAGAADGEMVSQITVPVPAFTDPALARNTTPERWFKIITEGNLDRFMPPWGQSLSESDRWHVIAYLYTLSANADQVSAGGTLYAANCEACHGATGVGDGPQAVAGSLPDFTSQAYMAARSNQEFLDSLSQAGHNFVDQLSGPELGAVTEYVRAFAFDPEPPEAGKGTVAGVLTNGTAGGHLSAESVVTLRIFDNFQEQEPLTAIVKPDGRFEFADLDLLSGRAFIVTINYQDVLYTSEVAEVNSETTQYQLPLTIYETASDPAVISIERLHIIFDFKPGQVQVGELVTFGNHSDKTFTSTTPGGPTVGLALPPGYGELTFRDGNLGERYLQTADGFVDTAPLGPGAETRQILFSYTLPYPDALTFSKTLPYPAAVINILIPESGVALSGPALVDAGLSTMQGGQFHTYTLANLPADQNFTFNLSGQPTLDSASTTAATAFNWRNFLIGLLALTLAGSILAYWWAGRTEPTVKAAKPEAQERLLAALAQLDDDFEAGQLAEAKYKARREKLKNELKQVLAGK